jgi:hypothetical protein
MYALQVFDEKDGWRYPQSWRKFKVFERYEDAKKEARIYAHARVVKLMIEAHEVGPKITAESTIQVVALEGLEGYWIELEPHERPTTDTIIYPETGRRFKPV